MKPFTDKIYHFFRKSFSAGLLFLLCPITLFATDKSTILIISSYNPDTQFTTANINAFSEEYVKLGGTSVISIENMNCQSLPESKEWKGRMGKILAKYKETPLKLIVLYGQEAWSSYLSQDEIPIKNIPVLCGMASRNAVLLPDENQNLNEWFPESVDVFDDMNHKSIKSGYAYEYDIPTNINLIRHLYPLTRNIAFISDNTYGGVSLQALVKKEMKAFADLNLIILDGRFNTIYEIIKDISELPPNTVILFGTWKVDASNAFFMKNAIYTMADVNPKVPVFSISSLGVGNWAIGGYSPLYQEQGTGMAQQAIDLEHNKEVEVKFIPNYYLFDANKVKEMGISLSSLPKNATLINKEEPFWKKYPMETTAIGITLFILIIGFMTTSYFYLRTKRIKEHLEKSEKELIIAKEHAEESSRLKTAFLANMSHEIRTPLNAIVGFSAVLAEENENPEQQEYLNIIQKNSDLLLRLINDILDVSRLESGRVQFNFSTYDIVQICHDQVATLNQVKKTDAEYIFDTQDEKFELVTDSQRLQQIIINLLNNAGKFTSSGSITLSYKKEPENNRVVFSVTDTGCGIPKEKQAKVFDRFEKLNEFAQGTGLGLSICKLTINKMGGDIWIDSSYNQGARFCFSHPLNLIPKENGLFK
ncbi:sensor histidine kinase [Coprobacter tertius]|uniref:histidine kinase n=1 Tax=Coprobacter tertius TaxID=2944915 RepID=A0ABT1MDJ4_9BACT|nr:ATP-binding protein [Coprobacter tertius]MCP9610714.1 ATP-binding protein [Coprobacter tertius]